MAVSEIHHPDVSLLLAEVEQEASARNGEVLALVLDPELRQRNELKTLTRVRFVRVTEALMEDSNEEWDIKVPAGTEYVVEMTRYVVHSLLTLKYKVTTGQLWPIGKAMFMTVNNDAFEVVPCSQ